MAEGFLSKESVKIVHSVYRDYFECATGMKLPDFEKEDQINREKSDKELADEYALYKDLRPILSVDNGKLTVKGLVD